MSKAIEEPNTGIFSHLAIARVTVECATALSIGSGEVDAVRDVMLIRDADGLPTIPGTALAGVLRHMYARNGHSADDIFGQARPEGRKENEPGYDASRLFVSWARVHDAKNNPAKHNISPDEIAGDDILRWLSQEQPVGRDHVRLSKHGTVAGNGKYERSAVPKGTRFTFEIMIEANSEEQAKTDFNAVMALIMSGLFRLGGAVWRGYGRMEHVATCYAILDLSNGNDRKTLGELSPDLAAELPPEFKPYETKGNEEPSTACVYELTVEPDGFYRFGGGDMALRERKLSSQGGEYEKDADDFVKTESVIEWDGDKASISNPKLLIPASSIKGALRHRIGFHARRKAGKFYGKDGAEDTPDIETSIFGNAKTNQDGQAGRIIIDDVYCEVDENDIGRMSHNAIDRFTHGTMDGALFDEELVWNIGFIINLTILPPHQPKHRTDILSAEERRALEFALDDLVSGRLPLGAGASNGHGFFTGEVKRALEPQGEQP